MPDRAAAPLPPAPPDAAPTSTRDRVLEAALRSFSARGYEATSLDALAARLGVRKQTILYYFPSKDALLGAVIDHAVAELAAALSGSGIGVPRRPRRGPARERDAATNPEAATDRDRNAAPDREAATERDRVVVAAVDAVLRLGSRHPELLELLREVVRLGPPASARLAASLGPVLGAASGVVPERIVLGAAAMVVGMGSEVEVLRALGVEPDLGGLRERRRRLLAYVRAGLDRRDVRS
ncbi:MAG: helix-turn-helix transcriptional regulator [Actinobacteria bacterium]|nr:helix-turn-helix transcriptional regulator [Actinomycetota bacterium]